MVARVDIELHKLNGAVTDELTDDSKRREQHTTDDQHPIVISSGNS